MSYCDNTDVANEFKKIDFTTNPVVTTSLIDQWIIEADAEINASVSMRYVSPITAGECLEYLKQISINLVAYRVQTKLSVKTGDGQGDQDSRVKSREDIARIKLKAIADGSVNLVGATFLTNQSGGKGFVSSGTHPRVFKTDVQQW